MPTNSEPLLIIHANGTITASPTLKPDEIAEHVLEALKSKWMDDKQATRIRQLEEDNAKLKGRIERARTAGIIDMTEALDQINKLQIAGAALCMDCLVAYNHSTDKNESLKQHIINWRKANGEIPMEE